MKIRNCLWGHSIKLGCVCLLMLLGAACNQVTDSARSIRFIVAQAPINLDPRYAADAASERVNRLIYQSLIDFDTTAQVIPELATWQTISPIEYRFKLKQARSAFHHGEPLTAQDVKATYDSLFLLKNSPFFAEFANISHIKVQGSDEITFYLKQADTHFLQKLIIGILPKNLIDKQHDFAHHPVGNGALAFEHWRNKLVLKRLSDGQIISLVEVKDPTVRVLKLLRGEADLLQGDLTPELVKYLRAQSEVIVKTGEGANFSYLGLNMQDPSLKQLKIRQAIAHAIDREAIIKQVMVANTRLASRILPPEHHTNSGTILPAYNYNPKLAKQLLNEAGIRLPLKLVYKTSTDAQRVRFATIMQAQMQKAGIDLEIRSLDWGTFFADVKAGNFQLYGLTWVGIKTPEIYSKVFGSNNFPPNGFNRSRYVDAKLDAQLAEGDWQSVTTSIHHQLPYIPLWYEGQFVAMRNNITGYTPKADGNWDDLASIVRE